MSVKKLAIFVEGKTELIFIERLLLEIAGKNKIEIKKRTLQGQNRCPSSENFTDNHLKYKVRVYNSCNESKVLVDIIDNYAQLISENFIKIIGIRDIYRKDRDEYPRKDIIQKRVINTLKREKLYSVKMIIAIREVETWFLAELNHYEKIHKDLTLKKINNELINLENIVNFEKEIIHPADTLNNIYQLVTNRHWTKSEKQINRTVKAIDYDNLYLNTKEKVPSLKELIDTLDEFFSR